MLLGEFDFDQEGETADQQKFTIANIKVHEKYNNVTYENDIAIITINGVATRCTALHSTALHTSLRHFGMSNRKCISPGWIIDLLPKPFSKLFLF